jgi:hypothetical protein
MRNMQMIYVFVSDGHCSTVKSKYGISEVNIPGL